MVMPPTTIETERLWLRQPQITDLDALAAIYADAEVMRFIKDGTRTRLQAAESLHALMDEWEHNKIGVWVVIEKYTEHLLGLCGFVGQAELGYIFAKSAWGMGIATEAARACIKYGFEVAGYEHIGAGALRENSASLHILQKLGMSPHPRAYFDEHGGAYFEIERSAWEKRAI